MLLTILPRPDLLLSAHSAPLNIITLTNRAVFFDIPFITAHKENRWAHTHTHKITGSCISGNNYSSSAISDSTLQCLQLILYSSNASRLFQCSACVSYYRKNRTKIYWPWWVYIDLSAIKAVSCYHAIHVFIITACNMSLPTSFLNYCRVGKEKPILLIPT